MGLNQGSIPSWVSSTGYGYGCGDVCGYGCGDGYGDGYGDGDSDCYGCSFGDGDGFGFGESYGDGYGDGFGSDYDIQFQEDEIKIGCHSMSKEDWLSDLGDGLIKEHEPSRLFVYFAKLIIEERE